MIPGTFTLQATAIAGAAALVVGLAGGAYASHAYYSPRLELAKSQVDQWEHKVDDQNKAIDDLRVAAKQRDDAASAAVAAAHVEAVKFQTRAQRVLATQKPAGKDDCTAAADLIAQELGK